VGSLLPLWEDLVKSLLLCLLAWALVTVALVLAHFVDDLGWTPVGVLLGLGLVVAYRAGFLAGQVAP
jgi:hypothetical protein